MGNFNATIYDVKGIDANIEKANTELKEKGELYRYARYDVHAIAVNMETFEIWDKLNKNIKKKLLKRQNRFNFNEKIKEQLAQAEVEKYKIWFEDLKKLAVAEFNFSEASAEMLNETEWLEAYSNGNSPGEALKNILTPS